MIAVILALEPVVVVVVVVVMVIVVSYTHEFLCKEMGKKKQEEKRKNGECHDCTYFFI